MKHNTLLRILNSRAADEPEKIAFIFHNDPPCSYHTLWQEITRVGQTLLSRGLPRKEPVIIAIPNSSHFFYAFYGVQQAGGIAVPVFPGSGVLRIIKLANLCKAKLIIVSKTSPPKNIDQLKQKAQEANLRLLFIEEDFYSSLSVSFPDILPHDTSFIQFTSGSTHEPNGVILTHANLITNLEQMIAGLEMTTADVFVSWLPVYHDMGLILMSMVPLFLGIPFTLLPAGLNYLSLWLQKIQEQKATFTAAPDFAYRLCLIYIRDPKNYNLSSLRVALNAAEPVRATTISLFEERFHLKNVLLPAYGLAEATVGVCSWKPGRKIKMDHRGFVSVGTPFPLVTMRVIRNNTPAHPGESGEIVIKSPANTAGYFQNPRATKLLFDKQGFIRTGDIGYQDEQGDYFIIGRKKNIIIQGGRNIAAREVEELVDQLPLVHRSAAISLDRGGHDGEQLYIFIEPKIHPTSRQNDNQFRDLYLQVVQCCDEALGLRPGRVYFLKHGTIPITYNGKIKYPHLKELFVKGTLKTNGLILFPHME